MIKKHHTPFTTTAIFRLVDDLRLYSSCVTKSTGDFLDSDSHTMVCFIEISARIQSAIKPKRYQIVDALTAWVGYCFYVVYSHSSSVYARLELRLCCAPNNSQ